MDNKAYRIKTEIGQVNPSKINIQLNQTFDTLEILSLKLSQENAYKLYNSSYGVIVGRVLANGGFGIPNAKLSVFVEVDSNETDENKILYPYTSVTSTNNDDIRYNLLPDEQVSECHQNVGTFPNKRLILDNGSEIEVFDKYWKYTTVTNQAGDYMFFGIPTGSQKVHVDIDLSDIGVLSQRPRDMIYKGYDINLFDSPNKFKQSENLNSLSQIITQDKGIYVYSFWGDTTNSEDIVAITRCDIEVEYKFEPTCIFLGSIITDTGSNAIAKNCTGTKKVGRLEDMVAGEGSIEMIRKTLDGKVEECQIKGNRLIDGNGVWCYQIPMNLDYVKTDEYGNIVPTDDPDKGIPTRARVRFRISLDENPSDASHRKRCKYLVPNNPRIDEDEYPLFTGTLEPDYEFGSATREESYCDLLWNKVYTVKNYIPRLQKTTNSTKKNHTGIKAVNVYGDNNPFPYNNLTIKLSFSYRLICIIIKVIILIVTVVNVIFSLIGEIVGLAMVPLKFLKIIPFVGKTIYNKFADFFESLVPGCIVFSENFCDDGINNYAYAPGCWGESYSKAKDDQFQESLSEYATTGEYTQITNSTDLLMTCIENSLLQEHDGSNFTFANDWINGCLYAPLWYRKKTKKKSYLFGLIRKKAKDQWCSSEKTANVKIYHPCALDRTETASSYASFNSTTKNVTPSYSSTSIDDPVDCGSNCQDQYATVQLSTGVIVPKTTSSDATIYYYKPLEYDSSISDVVLLFATDIVLLGSLNDCDLNGLPQFFKRLDISTYQLPEDILLTDYTYTPEYEDDGETLKDMEIDSMTEQSGCDWGNTGSDQCGEPDGGLFYSVGCSDIDMYPKSCINLSRVCEFGVSLDDTKFIHNVEADIDTEDDTEGSDQILIPDGFISYDEIYDFDGRSMFATLNGNNLRTKLNSNGMYEYDIRYLYPENFDGSLYDAMKEQQESCKKTAKYNYTLETFSEDYYRFRMGDTPFYYDDEKRLPRYENSFYFYFGLKAGETAIEQFNSQFFASCTNEDEASSQITYISQSNDWCSNDCVNWDGYIALDLTNIDTPYSITISSVYGNIVGYYSTSSDNPTLFLLNDIYTITVIDANENETSIEVNLANKYLSFSLEGDDFTTNDTTLLNKYNVYCCVASVTPSWIDDTLTRDMGGVLRIENLYYNNTNILSDGDTNSYLITVEDVRDTDGFYVEMILCTTSAGDKELNVIKAVVNGEVFDYTDTLSSDSASSDGTFDCDAIENGLTSITYENLEDEKIYFSNEVNSELDEDYVRINDDSNETSTVEQCTVTFALDDVEITYDEGEYIVTTNSDGYLVFTLDYGTDLKVYVEVEPDTDERYEMAENINVSGSYESYLFSTHIKQFYINGITSDIVVSIESNSGSDDSEYSGNLSSGECEECGYNINNGIYFDAENNVIALGLPYYDTTYSVTVTQLCSCNPDDITGNKYTLEAEINGPTSIRLTINDIDYNLISNFTSGAAYENGKISLSGSVWGWLSLSDYTDSGPYNWDNWLYSEYSVLSYYEDAIDEDGYCEVDGVKYTDATQALYAYRKSIIKEVKEAFWMSCNGQKLQLTLVSDNTPYTYAIIYKEEETSEFDDLYYGNVLSACDNETVAVYEDGNTIDDIEIPTLSYEGSDYYDSSVIGDNLASYYCTSYKDGGTNNQKYWKCPYFVKATDANGNSIPYGDNAYFGVHFIDKELQICDMVALAYINAIPYYKPNDATLYGETFTQQGFLAAIICNGMADWAEVVNDGKETINTFYASFDTQTFDDNDIVIVTVTVTDSYEHSGLLIPDEDALPTKRVIVGDNSGIYPYYDYITNNKDECGITDTGLDLEYETYVPVDDNDMALTIEDENCSIDETIYGGMNISLEIGEDKSFNLSEKQEVTIEVESTSEDSQDYTSDSYIDSSSTDEETIYSTVITSRQLTLNINSGSNRDFSTLGIAVTTYLFEYSKSNYLISQLEAGIENYSSYITCNLALGEDISGEIAYSSLYQPVFNEDDGIEEDGKYFVMSVTENGCCAISPVYDFTLPLIEEIIIYDVDNSGDSASACRLGIVFEENYYLRYYTIYNSDEKYFVVENIGVNDSNVKNILEGIFSTKENYSIDVDETTKVATHCFEIDESLHSTLYLLSTSRNGTSYISSLDISVVDYVGVWHECTLTNVPFVIKNCGDDVLYYLTLNLTNMTADIDTSTVTYSYGTYLFSSGSTLTVQLQVKDGYDFPESINDFTITDGSGGDAVYSEINYNSETGVLVITNAESNISIAAAAALSTYTITFNAGDGISIYQDMSSTDNSITSIEVEYGDSVEVFLSAESSYTLPENITVSGDCTYTYNINSSDSATEDSYDGIIIFNDIKSDVTVVISADLITYTVTFILSNVDIDFEDSYTTGTDSDGNIVLSVVQGTTVTATISVDDSGSYLMPGSIGVSGTDNYTYDSTNGDVVLQDITSDIIVEIAATENTFVFYDENGNLMASPITFYIGYRDGDLTFSVTSDYITSENDISISISDNAIITSYDATYDEDANLIYITLHYTENEDTNSRNCTIAIIDKDNNTIECKIYQYSSADCTFGFNDDNDNYTLDEKTILLLMSDDDYDFELKGYNVPYSGSEEYSTTRSYNTKLLVSQISGNIVSFKVKSISDDKDNEYETSDVGITYSSSYGYYLTVPVLAFTDDEKSRLLTIVLQQETTNSVITLYIVMTKVEITFSNATGLYNTLSDDTLNETYELCSGTYKYVSISVGDESNTDTEGSITITAKTFVNDYKDKTGTYYPFIIIKNADNTEISGYSVSSDETELQLYSTDIDRTETFTYYIKFAASVDNASYASSSIIPSLYVYIAATEEEEYTLTVSDLSNVLMYYSSEEQEDTITIKSYKNGSESIGFTLSLTDYAKEIFENGYISSCKVGDTDITSILINSGSYYVEDGGEVTLTFVSDIADDLEEVSAYIIEITQDESGLTSNIHFAYRIGSFELDDAVSIYDSDNSTLLSSTNTLPDGLGGDYCIHFTMESYIYNGTYSNRTSKGFYATSLSSELKLNNASFYSSSSEDEYEINVTVEENYSRSVRSFEIEFTQTDTSLDSETLTISQPETSWLFGINDGLTYDSCTIDITDEEIGNKVSVGPITSKNSDSEDVEFSVTNEEELADYGITVEIQNNILYIELSEDAKVDGVTIELEQATSGLTMTFVLVYSATSSDSE